MKRALVLLSIAIFIGHSPCAAGDFDWPTKTTPEQRARIAAAMRILEATPALDDAKLARTAAFKWVTESPDIHLKWCAGMLVDIPKKESALWGGLLLQAILSAAAFSIESPSHATDHLLVARAGLRGALRTYEATLAARPTPRSEFFDNLLKAESAGKLDDYINPKLVACRAAGMT